MSTLSNKDLHTPLTQKTIEKVKGHIHAMTSPQAAAASAAATLMGVASQSGTIRSLYVLSAVVAGAGESMTVQVLVNGVSILTGGTAYTIDASTIPAASLRKQIELPLDPEKKAITAGDIITCTRVYAAGGTPTPMTATLVGIEIS